MITTAVLALASTLVFGGAGLRTPAPVGIAQSPDHAAGPQASPPSVLEAKPPSAGACTLQGSSKVTVSVLVTAEGLPSQLAVTTSSGNDCIDGKALEAVRAYKFRPATRDGHAVETKINILVNFQRF